MRVVEHSGAPVNSTLTSRYGGQKSFECSAATSCKKPKERTGTTRKVSPFAQHDPQSFAAS
jgi:hypothetical protein